MATPISNRASMQRLLKRPQSLHRRIDLVLLLAFSLMLITACGGDEVAGVEKPAKPVSTMVLSPGVPRSETRVAGVVEPYRQSDMSFDVSGVLTQVIDLGDTAEGPQLDGKGGLLLDQQGVPVKRGTVLAALDTTRFEQSVTAAQLAIASNDREIGSLKTELDEVYPARIGNAEAAAAAASADVRSARESVSSSEAELKLARTSVERDRVLIQSGAIAQSVLDESESNFVTATANLARARAALESALQSERSASASLQENKGQLRVQQANLETLKAAKAELINALEQAKTDLDSCVLRAPFDGRVTGRYLERGGYVNAGTPILELTMEAVVKVVITVSAEEERLINIGSQLPIYVDLGETDNGSEIVMGAVFEKAGIADTGTRTFRIGLILPNPLISDTRGSDRDSLVAVGDLFPVLNPPGLPEDALYINVACIYRKDGKDYVLALKSSQLDLEPVGSLQTTSLIPITLTDEWAQLDTTTLRRIKLVEGLESGDALLIDPQPDDEAGVRVGMNQYAFRPGDVVRVGVDAALPSEGLWVPATAIVERTGEKLLYVIDNGKAREVLIDILETSGGFRRVTSEDLGEQAQVVVRGMQYLADGDAVVNKLAAGEGGR
ncbi:MAG: HlyD family efflux transporter periplasmic adaptor subunit [Planctomycetota bacterium]